MNFNFNDAAGITNNPANKSLQPNMIHTVTFDGCEAIDGVEFKNGTKGVFSNNFRLRSKSISLNKILGCTCSNDRKKSMLIDFSNLFFSYKFRISLTISENAFPSSYS